jgi:hypothetical protein
VLLLQFFSVFELCLQRLVALGGAVFSACSDLNSPVTNTIELVLFLSMVRDNLL